VRRSARLAWQLCPPTGREPDRAARKFVAVNFVLAPNRFHQAGGSHPGKCPRLPRISPSDGLGPIWLLNLNVGSTAGKRPTSSPHAVTAPPPPRWPSSRQSEADRHSRASVESRCIERRTCWRGPRRAPQGREGRRAIRGAGARIALHSKPKQEEWGSPLAVRRGGGQQWYHVTGCPTRHPAGEVAVDVWARSGSQEK